MNIKKIIRLALDDCGWTQKMLATKCGYRTQSAVANKLTSDNIRLDTLLPILDAMGFELIVQSKNQKKKIFVLLVRLCYLIKSYFINYLKFI